MSGVRLARGEDIPELVRLRALLFEDLAATWGPAPGGDAWRDACAGALALRLADHAMRVVVVGAGTGLVCCGMGAVDLRLPGPFNPGGLIGHIFADHPDPPSAGPGHASDDGLTARAGVIVKPVQRGLPR